MLDSTPMDHEPADPDEITPRHWRIFGVGLGLYACGFVLLGLNLPNLAPIVIVSGIVTMLGAFIF